MAVGRQLLAAATGADGRIYAVGGHNLGALNLLEIYDPARNQWTLGAPMPTPRYDMGVALGGDGRIYAIGGSGDGVFNVLDVVEAYSPATNSWTTVAPLPSRRALVDAAAGPDGRIYAIGGCELVTDAAGNLDCVDSKRVDVYSPQANVWETLSPTIVAHREGAATTDGKRIFAIGGHTDVVEIATLIPTPPAVTIIATPDTLWPPNGRLVPVTIAGTITDEDSAVDEITATYAVIDEYGSVQPSGHITLDASGRYSFRIRLQASRNGNDADGRQYTITVRAVDDEGNEGSAPPSSLCRMIRGRVGASPRASVPQACPVQPERWALVGWEHTFCMSRRPRGRGWVAAPPPQRHCPAWASSRVSGGLFIL